MKGDDKNDVFGLGLFPEDGKTLVDLVGRHQDGGTPPVSQELDKILTTVLEWIGERARDGLDKIGPNTPIPERLKGGSIHEKLQGSPWEPDRRIEDPTRRHLEQATRTLQFLLGEGADYAEAHYFQLFQGNLDLVSAMCEAASHRTFNEWTILIAIELGMLAAELGLKPNLPDILRGKKIVEGARKGHEATHGTKEKKHAEWAEWQRAVDEFRERNPAWSRREVARHVGEKFDITERTIRKRTKDNRPK